MSEYEKICFVCKRPESVTGKMIALQPNLFVCPDCMQKSMDAMNNMPFDYNQFMNNPGMPVMGWDEMENEIPKTQRVKKRAPEEERVPIIALKDIPAPHKIKEKLDEYVVGQEHAKKAMSVAVYNHYKRVAADPADQIEIEKSNMLMIGPTGSGKTYLVKTLAKILDVPLAITDATSLTEAGYIGDDIESVVSKLLAAAGNDVDKAEQGIIFIDEIDKIAKKKNSSQRDVSGESVQQGMLKLLEGSEVEVPVGATSKNAMVPLVTVNTKNILFICGGAFDGIDKIIGDRVGKKGLGFGAEIESKGQKKIGELLQQITPQDLLKFGLIPEFIGRLPIMAKLNELDINALIDILTKPKNALIRQYQTLFDMDNVELEFDKDAVKAIAEKAEKRNTGARGLRSIIEEIMTDIMFEIPSDDDVVSCIVHKECITDNVPPEIIRKNRA